MSENQRAIEIEIASRLRSNDTSVFEYILREFGPGLLARLRKRFSYLLSEEDFEDVLSLTLYRVWRNSAAYNPSLSPLRSWCYVIARTIAIDLIRDKERRTKALEMLWFEVHDSGPRVERTILPEVARLKQALSVISSEDREILLASVSDDPSWAASLAPALGLTANAIRQRRFRAMSRVRTELLRGSHSG